MLVINIPPGILILILLVIFYLATGRKMTSKFGNSLAWIFLFIFLAFVAYLFFSL